MLTSLSLIFLVGLAMGAICQKIKLPRIIGMLVTGIVSGPYVLDFLDPSILSISADLRKMALIIILLKAGLSLDLKDLKKVGRPAVLMAFLPASFELAGYVLLGSMFGYGIYLFFENAYANKHCVRNSMKVIIVLGFSFLLIAIEGWLEGKVAVSGLLAVVSMACVLKRKSDAFVSRRLSEKFGKLWLSAEVMLFVLVGATVDIRYTMDAGAAALIMILAALVFRACGVLLSVAKTNLTWKERMFCVIAYLPKATVQAAIGSVPLAAGLPCGKIVLSVAVMAIVITAPIGAFGMDHTYQKLLTKG